MKSEECIQASLVGPFFFLFLIYLKFACGDVKDLLCLCFETALIILTR
jgi:hypothetical protein